METLTDYRFEKRDNEYERKEGEEPPLGIILCAEKNQEQIELLEMSQSGIHVAEYLTQLPPKDVFQSKLQLAITIAREKLTHQNNSLAFNNDNDDNES